MIWSHFPIDGGHNILYIGKSQKCGKFPWCFWHLLVSNPTPYCVLLKLAHSPHKTPADIDVTYPHKHTKTNTRREVCIIPLFANLFYCYCKASSLSRRAVDSLHSCYCHRKCCQYWCSHSSWEDTGMWPIGHIVALPIVHSVCDNIPRGWVECLANFGRT